MFIPLYKYDDDQETYVKAGVSINTDSIETIKTDRGYPWFKGNDWMYCVSLKNGVAAGKSGEILYVAENDAVKAGLISV